MAHAASPRGQGVTDASAGLSGEYTDAADPDTPISFYVENGKLVMESERMVPTALNQNSPTEFGVPQTKMTLKFTVDVRGHGVSVVSTNDPNVIYKRTGDAVHHIFHDYQRSEAMIPMRDGVKLHTVILKPADIASAAAVPHAAHAVWRAMEPLAGHSSAAALSWRATATSMSARDIRGRFKSEGQFVMSRPQVDHHDRQGHR